VAIGAGAVSLFYLPSLYRMGNVIPPTFGRVGETQCAATFIVQAPFAYKDEARELLAGFASWRIQHVPRKLVVARLGH